jgi:Short C-terminal domain
MGCRVFGQSWDKAEATIFARDAKFTGDGSVATYTYVADVRLSSGETFRATIHEPTIATDFWAPSIRDVVSVLVRPKDRKVKFDKDDDRLSVKAYEAAKKKAFEDAQQQPTGTPPVSPTPTSQIPDAVAAKLAQLGINGGAPMQVFTADSAQGQAALAAFTHAGAPVAQTVESRLAKLQALHESGLLTADEYAEQRHRILDEL